MSFCSASRQKDKIIMIPALALRVKLCMLGHRSQVTGHRSQVTGHRSQVTGHRSQCSSKFFHILRRSPRKFSTFDRLFRSAPRRGVCYVARADRKGLKV
jgi:hypothetical protein